MDIAAFESLDRHLVGVVFVEAGPELFSYATLGALLRVSEGLQGIDDIFAHLQSRVPMGLGNAEAVLLEIAPGCLQC